MFDVGEHEPVEEVHGKGGGVDHMGNKQRPRDDSDPLRSASAVGGQSNVDAGHPSAPTDGAGASARGGDGATERTRSVTTLKDGTICIGEACVSVRILSTADWDVEIDVSKCDPDVRDAILDRIQKGAGADFRVRRT